MARWKLRKKYSPLSIHPRPREGGFLQLEDSSGAESFGGGGGPQPVPVAAPGPASELLQLHAALEEMAHLRTVAEPPPPFGADLAETAPPARTTMAAARQEPLLLLPGEVTETGELRLIRITSEIHALIEPEAAAPVEGGAPAVEEEAAFCSAWLPAGSREAFEILHPRCPSRWAEALRKLRGRMMEERARWEAAGRRLNSVAVVSPRRAGGRSAAARNLAACLGVLPDARVLLVDADVGRPSLHHRLRLNQSPGLTDAIAAEGGGDWHPYVHRVPGSGLYVLTLGKAGAGMDPIDPVRMPAFLARARAHFSWVILDAPPMETADGEALSAVTDGAVLVLRNEREYFDEASAAVRRMDPSRVLGAILNFA